VDSEGSGTGSRSLDWDLSWGQNGVLIHKSINSYNYDVHHSKLQKSAMVPSIQCSTAVVPSWMVAYHWGDLVTANAWMDRQVIAAAGPRARVPRQVSRGFHSRVYVSS
jgi:hypothetical protein